MAIQKSRRSTAGQGKSGVRGIKSAGVGAVLLKRLAAHKAPIALRDLALTTGMTASNAYRYLVSFIHSGLVRQMADGRYDLGPAAIELGLAALARIDGLALADRALQELTEETGLDGHIAVMGSAGPTVVRWQGRPREVSLRVNEGTVLPMLVSATGRLFAVYLPPAVVEPILAEEIDRFSRELDMRPKQLRARLEESRTAIRKAGLSVAAEERRPGIDAIAAPIFGRGGGLVYSFTLIGLHGSFDRRAEGDIARKLRDSAGRVSRQLGAGMD